MKSRMRLFALILAVWAFAAPAAAQWQFFPYYGKNRVQYDRFDWKTYDTDHFTIYHYTDDLQTLREVAAAAENAYERLSHLLKHTLSKRVPLLYYRTFTDFQQTNLFQVPEGVLGVAEPVLHRVALHADMSYDEFQLLVKHELMHIFQFDILWGHQGASLYAVTQPPLWTFEGLSEYATRKWSSWSRLIVKDAVLNDRIPEFSESGELVSRYPLPREPAYDFGHAIYEFMEKEFGRNAIPDFWKSLKSPGLFGRRDLLRQAFKIDLKEFHFRFKKHLREEFKDYLTRENPEDYSFPMGPEFPSNPYYFAFSPDLSPSGDLAAVITYNVRDFDLDVVIISTRDGSVVRNLTKGYSRQYEYIKYAVDPSDGRSLAWSRDGDTIAFFARDGRRHALILIDPISGRIRQKIPIPLDQPHSPSFLPSNRELVFTAFDKGIHDIFKIDIENKALVNLTRDRLFEKAPVVSPDGLSVAYALRIGGKDKLFISPLADMAQKTQLTFGDTDDIAPQFSPDSKTLWYSSDGRDSFNIYSLDLETGETRRHTDVRTGNFFPAPMAEDPERVVFASFNKGSFQLFKSAFDPVIETTAVFKPFKADPEAAEADLPVDIEIDESRITPREGGGKFFVTSRPPIDAVVSTSGAIYGGSAISLSDMLGDRTLFFMAYQANAFRSYYGAYLNQTRRFNTMVSAFSLTQFYYPPFYYYNPELYYRMSYQDAIATRKIIGLSAQGLYPFSRYTRFEAGVGLSRYEEDFSDPYSLGFGGGSRFGYFWNGNLLSGSVALVGETTRFKPYGPAAGSTFRASVSQSVPVSASFFSNTTLELDVRRYLNIGADFLFAFRFQGYYSGGRNPFLSYWGGNNQVRSVNFYNIVGTEGWFGNAEFRFPLISVAQTVLGPIGPVRGVFFFDITRSKLPGREAKFYEYLDIFGLRYNAYDALGSVGYGFQVFFMGFPIHFEFVKMLKFPDISKPWDFVRESGMRSILWIGFDF
jgi:hypothetical protein